MIRLVGCRKKIPICAGNQKIDLVKNLQYHCLLRLLPVHTVGYTGVVPNTR
jgi:hypothetical protein